MPQQTSQPAKPAATAAHPRAFRGTKFQPPKPSQNESDLHAWLADDRLLDGFFARHDFERFPVLGPDGSTWPGNGSLEHTPSVSRLLAQRGAIEDANIPVAFRRHFLWLLRTAPSTMRLTWLALWRALGAPSHGALLAILARICGISPATHAWAELALNLPQERQPIYLISLLKHQSCRLPSSHLNSEQLCTLDAISKDDKQFEAYLNVALENLSRGVSVVYTLIGCQLPTSSWGQESLMAGLRTASNCDDVPVADIGRMLAALGDDGRHWARSAWDYCATQPGYARILRETSWESMTSTVADRWLSLFRVSEWDFPNPAIRSAQWRLRLAMFPELQRQLLALPRERQERFVSMLFDYSCGWENAETLRDSWPVLLPLQVRLCLPPFESDATGNHTLAALAANVGADGWRRLAAMPDSTWRAIEQACRRDNDASLIRYGLFGLTEAMPDFVLSTLISAPKRLMQSMSLVGCLEYNTRRRFLAQAVRTPWFANQWEDMAATEACERILALSTEYGLDSPLPRRLREQINGKANLSEQQIARHCGVTLARLPYIQLAALDAMAWQLIDGPFNLRSESTAASHAVRLHASINGGNRKALKRFLLGYAKGGVHTYLDHPLNRAWYARHARIDMATWGGGQLRKFVGEGTLQISIETDPLEILMLGSYVGSCLGLGGICEYSSVACLVDANKQVVYARNASGRVLARQLLAIDERDRLVCFEVYPQSADAQLRQAFRQFDAELAESLGIGIYRDDSDDFYEVPTILAMEWWDDGQWRTSDEKATTNKPA
ncbi:hypothetical protein [Pseudoduganella violaceinigra]|uniref:hypothetical protein n=1 Tax=Pseudoduganella violaceinigra TaxID=246602 RepID=UPI0012B66779|nr:hypothetical protein [Pseudoduganella violaceinigra]